MIQIGEVFYEALDEMERAFAGQRQEALLGNLWKASFAELAVLLTEEQVRDALRRMERTVRQQMTTSPKIPDEQRGFAEELTNDFLASANEMLRTLYPPKP